MSNSSSSAGTRAPQADVVVENHGSIYLFRPLSDSARTWVDEYIGADNGYQPYYPTVVVEHR
jgi:hypothetical protein